MADKWQAIQEFWESFGLPAYAESSVPDDAKMPYITYSPQIGQMDAILNLTGSLWYESVSWAEISRKALQIAFAVNANGYYLKKIDGGYMLLTQGDPFAQRMTDENDKVRRIYFNIQAKFLTAY